MACRCCQLLLSVAVNGLSIQSANPLGVLPAATAVIGLADSHERAAFTVLTKMKEEPMDVETVDTNKEEVRRWLAVAGSGWLWLALAGPGWLWLALAGSGLLWLALAGSGWLWLALAGSGWLWLALAGSGWLWLALAGSGWLWLALAGCGWPWLALAGPGWPWLALAGRCMTMFVYVCSQIDCH